MLGKKKLILLMATLILVLILVTTFLTYYFVRYYFAERNLVVTKSGAIEGISSTSRDGRTFYEWLGIPYAKAPLGRLRFRSPEPIDKWEGILDASRYGASCVQNNMFFQNSVVGEEDCLFLNVFAPKVIDENKVLLPVLVYIHAGAFLVGSSSVYRPEYFMDEDVILVTINYRLVLGFLTAGDKEIRGNMGLKDQVQALKWIQENIESFGGNPSKVTIFGHSAGGASVHFMLLSSMTKGLFKKAISHSGAATNPWSFVSQEVSLKKTYDIAQVMNCPTNTTEQLAKCLQSANINQLMKTVWKDDNEAPIFQPNKFGQPILPTVENIDDKYTFLKETPFEIIISGKAHPIPWMVGHTADEGLLSTLGFSQNLAAMEDFEDNWSSCIKSVFALQSSSSNNMSSNANETANHIRDFYLPPFTRSTMIPEHRIQTYAKLFGDSFFNFDIRESIFYQRQFSPVYPYFFNRTGGPTIDQLLEVVLSSKLLTTVETMVYVTKQFLKSLFGMQLPQDDVAYHILDMNFLFPFYPIFDIPTGSKHYEFSKNYVKLLVDFAKDESIMAFNGVQFPETPKTGPLNFFKITNASPEVNVEPFLERMEFLHSMKIR